MAVPGAVTDPDRITGESLIYPSADGSDVEAYLVRPRDPGPHPGVLVIHEAFGLNDHIRDVANRFAARGYIALAPDLYTRRGRPDPAVAGSVMGIMFGLPDAEAVRDMEAGARRIREDGEANGRVGIVGFCSGGRHSLLMACSSTQVDAAVACWGGFIRTATPDQATTDARPTPVVDLAPSLQCPLWVAIGAEDQNPSPADGAELQEHLAGVQSPVTIKVYQDAGHAFFADYRPTYREQAAFELWSDATGFLDRHLQRR